MSFGKKLPWILLLWAQFVGAEYHSDAFLIQVMDRQVKVVAPEKYHKGLNVIIENKTLSRLLGKLETVSGQLIGHVSIPSEKFQSIDLPMEQFEKTFFVPMAPAFQAIELKIGAKSYQIPPAK